MNMKYVLLTVITLTGLFPGVYSVLAQGWSATSAPTNSWSSIASSADGSKLVAVALGGGIYTSTNSGCTWILTSAASNSWTCVASSTDGTRLLAAGGRPIYTSTN